MSQDSRMSNLAFRGLALWLRLRESSLSPKKILEDAGVSPGQVVLDYGCGIGSYAIPAARMVGDGGRVYALDIHPLAIESVERRARKEHLTNIKTICSGLDTDLAGSSVDTILLYDVLHSVPNQQALLQELYRVLKAGGRLSILPDHMSSDELLSVVQHRNLFDMQAQHGEVFEFLRSAAGGL